MAEKRKDSKGRNLKTGEYYDPKNKRYMFRKMIDGKRITITEDDLIELRKKENELLCMMDKGAKFNNKKAKITLNDYFDFWLEMFAKSGRKATTCTNYKSYYNTYVRESIGQKQIVKVTKADCQQIINEMMKDQKKHSTMANLKSCLNIVFECAVDDDIVVKNPVKNLQLPQTESKKREAISRDQIDLFMGYVKNSNRYSYSYPVFVVLFNTGMRIGELVALTWDDVNFEDGTITVNKSLNRYRKKDYGFTMAIGSTKSKTSNRTITMSSTVKTILMRLKMQNVQTRATLPIVDDSGNVRGTAKGFIFQNTTGNVWSEPAFRDLITRIIEQYNKEAEKEQWEKLENFCPHMTRHTYTSLAYSAGVDMKIVSQMLGHASSSVTLDTYTHLSQEEKKKQETLVKTIKIS